MIENKFKGLGVALITPFKENKSVDFEALERMIDFLIENNTDFLCVLGTTAETPTLSHAEKMAIRECVVNKVNKRVPILLGVGGNSTLSVVEDIKNDAFEGIDGILSVVPFYNKPTQEGMYQHFKAISAASKLPIVLYNVPGRTGVNMTAATTLRIVNECENVVAIKEASGNIDQINAILKDKPARFDVISGDDGLTYPILTLGGAGVISVVGNALPKIFSQMIHSTLEGKNESALKIHRQLSNICHLLFVDGNPAGVKAMLHLMGLVKNELRLPLVRATAKTTEAIKEEMKNF